jgi:hypothetical protein
VYSAVASNAQLTDADRRPPPQRAEHVPSWCRLAECGESHCNPSAFSFLYQNSFAPSKVRPMYRCHFMQAGRTVQGLNLKVETLDAAIATGRKILADHIELIDCDGLEIWLDSALLYKFAL